MNRNVIETVLGAVVLLVAAMFLAFAYTTVDVGAGRAGYDIQAKFSAVNGLSPGSDVRIAGVKVGTVVAQSLDPTTYQAVITMRINHNVELPLDTSATVTPESLLGGSFLELQPGAEIDMLAPGEEIIYTDSVPSLGQMIGQLLFSINSAGSSGGN